MHLPQVWRQVWLRWAELRWAQRGSDSENRGRGDEEGFEVGTSQGRVATASRAWGSRNRASRRST